MSPLRTAVVSVIGACAQAMALAAPPAEPQPTVIESTGPMVMVSTDTETTVTHTGNVVVTGTNIRLTCDHLEYVVLRKGDPAAAIGTMDKFKSLIATGNVRIVQGDREAACGRAEVRPREDRIILTDNPVVVSHDEGFRGAGETIIIHRGERRVEILQPRLVGPPIKDLGFEPAKPPAAPATDAPRQP